MKIVLMCMAASIGSCRILFPFPEDGILFSPHTMKTSNLTSENVQELGEDWIFAATQHTEIRKYFL